MPDSIVSNAHCFVTQDLVLFALFFNNVESLLFDLLVFYKRISIDVPVLRHHKLEPNRVIFLSEEFLMGCEAFDLVIEFLYSIGEVDRNELSKDDLVAKKLNVDDLSIFEATGEGVDLCLPDTSNQHDVS